MLLETCIQIMFWSRGKVSFDDAGDRDGKGADARERGRLKSSDTPDIRNQTRSSFIAKGEGSFIDQERRSGRRVSSATRSFIVTKRKSEASAGRPRATTSCAATTTTKTAKATSSVAPFTSDRRFSTCAGSGGDDVVSEGVESKHPELMI